uniref:Collagen alpha-6(VI) chain-like protein n=1 Tax=Halisarca dujardinii TaxID=2583056 RepID=A0AA96MMY8_HALDU|nr:collagen alpha-6(VI) chain-like protein [Halisarca dujardinii]
MNVSGTCVPKDNCCTVPGAVYLDWGTCVATCDAPEPLCGDCMPACGCPEGYVLHQAACIPRTDCPTVPCSNKTDIVLLVDSSASVCRKKFTRAQNFLATLVEKLPIGENTIRVAEVIYGLHPELVFSLPAYSTAGTLSHAIRNVEYARKCSTKTGKAIQFVVDYYSGLLSGRFGTNRILIVVTDGKSMDDVQTAAKNARQAGFNVIAIGVGAYADAEELMMITGSEGKVVMVAAYSVLQTVCAQIWDIINVCCYYGISQDDCEAKECCWNEETLLIHVVKIEEELKRMYLNFEFKLCVFTILIGVTVSCSIISP